MKKIYVVKIPGGSSGVVVIGDGPVRGQINNMVDPKRRMEFSITILNPKEHGDWIRYVIRHGELYSEDESKPQEETPVVIRRRKNI